MGGLPLLAWTTFIFAAHFTFPYERVRDRLVEALSRDFEVSILDISPGLLPGRVSIEGLSLTTRPKRDDEKPRTLTIERVDLALSVLALIGRTVSVDVDAKLGGGRLVGNVRQSPSAVVVDLRTEDVSLESVPGLDAITGGAPIVGPFMAKVKLNLPKGKWTGAQGGLELGCSGCTIGDGVTKVRPMNPGQQNAFTSEGMTLPRIRLGEFTGRIQINKGVACIERFSARGGDVELTLEGGVTLKDPFKDSQAQLQAKLKSSDEFRKASVRNAALFTGVRDADGFVAYVARNAPLLAMRWLESRSPFTPMAECRGIGEPPPPSSSGKPSVARGAAPQNPVAPGTPGATSTATPPVATGVPGTTGIAPPPETPPATNGGATELSPPATIQPSPGNDLQPSANPTVVPSTTPPQEPSSPPPPPAGTEIQPQPDGVAPAPPPPQPQQTAGEAPQPVAAPEAQPQPQAQPANAQ